MQGNVNVISALYSYVWLKEYASYYMTFTTIKNTTKTKSRSCMSEDSYVMYCQADEREPDRGLSFGADCLC